MCSGPHVLVFRITFALGLVHTDLLNPSAHCKLLVTKAIDNLTSQPEHSSPGIGPPTKRASVVLVFMFDVRAFFLGTYF